MSKFLLAFHGGKMPENPADMQAIMSKWEQWMNSIGQDVIDPGSIVGNNQCLSASGKQELAKSAALTGYMIISSNSMEAAITNAPL